MTDTTDKNIPQYSKNPCIDLGIVENVSRIEVKWYLEGADSDQELEVVSWPHSLFCLWKMHGKL